MRIRFFEITRGKNKISMKFVYKNISYTEEEEISMKFVYKNVSYTEEEEKGSDKISI